MVPVAAFVIHPKYRILQRSIVQVVHVLQPIARVALHFWMDAVNPPFVQRVPPNVPMTAQLVKCINVKAIHGKYRVPVAVIIRVTVQVQHVVTV